MLWWPHELFGVEVRGLPNPNEDELKAHLRRETAGALGAYSFTLEDREPVAGTTTNRWKVVPKRAAPHRFVHRSWNHERYSFPLKMAFEDAAGAPWYAMEFRAITFGQEVPPETFAFEFPPNAVVFRWDLRDAGIPLAEAQRTMNFDVRLPTYLPEGLELKKLVRGKHELPMVTAVMHSGATWVSLTEDRHLGGHLALPVGRPVAIGETQGALSFMGPYTVVSWALGNTHLTLIGNVAFPELLKVAASVE